MSAISRTAWFELYYSLLRENIFHYCPFIHWVLQDTELEVEPEIILVFLVSAINKRSKAIVESPSLKGWAVDVLLQELWQIYGQCRCEMVVVNEMVV